MTDEQDIRRAVRAYITENFLYMRPGLQFGDDDALLAKGIIDSLGVMELVSLVEEQFGVKPLESEITQANFGSVSGLARFVAGRRGTPAASDPRG